MTDWHLQTAAHLGRGIGAGIIDPVDLVDHYLDRIAAHPLTPRIYARTTEARAHAEAHAARIRAKSGMRRSLLDGVPLSWKDLFDTAGTPTEAGTALLTGRVPDHDAQVLQTATIQGAVCLGKTHMTELAFSGLGLNPVTASPPCVNDPQAVSGGSSSGAATSVAFHLAPAAIGSDTGGSVRIPAAWNDLVGLKTTLHRLPTTGTVPLCPSFDTVGPIAKSVEDCALILALLSGETPIDLTPHPLTARFGVLQTVALDVLRPEPASAFDDALTRLAKSGATLTPLHAPELAEALSLVPLLFAPEAYATCRALIEAAPDKMYPLILDRFRSGAHITAADHIAATQRLQILRQIWTTRCAPYDAILLPTAPIIPPNAQRALTDPAYFAAENLLALRNTRLGNLMNQCVITLPTGHKSCGISLMAPPNHEHRLLRLAQAAERALL